MMTKPVQSRRFHFLTAERSGEKAIPNASASGA
jgi:hypothetical protein